MPRFAAAMACAAIAVWCAGAETRPLVILHTNDLHSHLVPSDNGLGGFAELATALRQEREGCKHCLLLNAGDLAQGSPVSTIFHGLPVFEIANRIGIDAATLGNHDFDYGWMQTRKFLSTARYPIVSANIVDESGKLFTKKGRLLLKAGGLRIGIVGAMTEQLRNLTTPVVRGPWKTSPLIDAVRREALELRRDADLVVLVAHLTDSEERRVLEEVPEIAVVVSGHNHNGLDQPVASGNRLVVRCKGDAVEFGRLDLQVDPGQKAIASWAWKKIPVDASRWKPAPDVAREVAKWEGEVQRRVDLPLATAARAFDKPEVRTLMERAMREETGADFAFMNLGGVRDVLPAGQIKVRHIWNIMPFDNRVVFGRFKGKQLPAPAVRGVKVDPEREYTLAVSDFTAENQGGRSQLQTTGLTFSGEGPLLRDLLIDWFRKKRMIE